MASVSGGKLAPDEHCTLSLSGVLTRLWCVCTMHMGALMCLRPEEDAGGPALPLSASLPEMLGPWQGLLSLRFPSLMGNSLGAEPPCPLSLSSRGLGFPHT